MNVALRSAPFFVDSGPVAQLGARFHGMEEVVGSIPTRSTKIAFLGQMVKNCGFTSPTAPLSLAAASNYRREYTCRFRSL